MSRRLANNPTGNARGATRGNTLDINLPGEVKLVTAIIEAAIGDLKHPRRATWGETSASVFESAYRFLFLSPHGEELCRAINVDIEAIRDGLKRVCPRVKRRGLQ